MFNKVKFGKEAFSFTTICLYLKNKNRKNSMKLACVKENWYIAPTLPEKDKTREGVIICLL